jgi:hypothetical protein
LPKENITLHVKASSRTSSEKHLEHHMEGHVRAYCKELAEKVRVFLAEEKLHEIVFRCPPGYWVVGTVSNCTSYTSVTSLNDTL